VTASATGVNTGAIGPDGQRQVKSGHADQGGPETDMTRGPILGVCKRAGIAVLNKRRRYNETG